MCPLASASMPLLETSSFADWQAVSRVHGPALRHDGCDQGGAVRWRRRSRRLSPRVPIPFGAAGAALELVQAKVRYLFNGLDRGNYVPQTPEQTWTLRYGDCKAKTLLLLAILRGLDIDGEPVLANAQIGDAVPERLPSAAAFNHVLVHAKRSVASDYWLDGTRRWHAACRSGRHPAAALGVAGARVGRRACSRCRRGHPAGRKPRSASSWISAPACELPAIARMTATWSRASLAGGDRTRVKTQGTLEQKQEAVKADGRWRSACRRGDRIYDRR